MTLDTDVEGMKATKQVVALCEENMFLMWVLSNKLFCDCVGVLKSRNKAKDAIYALYYGHEKSKLKSYLL